MRLRHLAARLLPALALALTAACADPPTAARPVHAPRAMSNTTGYPTGVVRYVLEQASAGLTYTSESDRPFVWYQRPGPVALPLSVEGFRAALALPAEVPVETRDLDAFFARHIELVDPADSAAVALVPRYVALRQAIRDVLRAPVVFRVGRIAIDCYIVGLDRAGNLVGLTTVAVET